MLSSSGHFADVNDGGYLSLATTVGTTQVEVKVGGSRLSKRQRVLIYNDSTAMMFVGPTGVTSTGATKGIPVEPGTLFPLPVGDNTAVYVIASTAASPVIFQEVA